VRTLNYDVGADLIGVSRDSGDGTGWQDDSVDVQFRTSAAERVRRPVVTYAVRVLSPVHDRQQREIGGESAGQV
jgi:hypothetical protein